MLIKMIVAHILANIGTWFCTRAIRWAGGGYIEFEVATPQDPYRRY